MAQPQLVLAEDGGTVGLYPLTLTRPASHLRVGIDLLVEKWQRHWPGPVSLRVPGHLQAAFDSHSPTAEAWLLNSRLLPTPALLDALKLLEPGEGYAHEGQLVALRGVPAQLVKPGQFFDDAQLQGRVRLQPFAQPQHLRWLHRPADIFGLNAEQLRTDFAELTHGRASEPLADAHTRAYNPAQIFLEAGARLRACVLNAEDGPIYIGHHAEVHEGALVHGGHALLAHSVVNMGAKLRGDSTLGPGCKVGGELSNSVLWGYSNKAHDGFLGNSVLGAWCNLGADTNTSNLKNNYGNVRVHHYGTGRAEDSGRIFHGLVMGDHSKCAINTQFNTGTVVGVAANVFGSGFPPKFVPSFAWGATPEAGWETHRLEDALQTARRVLARRNLQLSPNDEAILKAIMVYEAPLRHWEARS